MSNAGDADRAAIWSPTVPKEAGQEEGLTRLHGGRHSLSPQLVAHNQRERLLAATAAVVGEHGYNGLTVTLVTKKAAVSRRTFYEHFTDKEDCFLATFDALEGYLATRMEDEAAAEVEWPRQVSRAFSSLIEFLAERPNFARLYLVEAAVVGRGMDSRRERMADRLAALLVGGRSRRSVDRELAEGFEDALIGGVITLLGHPVVRGEPERIAELTPDVLEFLLTPYLGRDGARAALTA